MSDEARQVFPEEVEEESSAALSYDATTVDFTGGSNDFIAGASSEVIDGVTATAGDAANADTLSTSGTGLQIAPKSSQTVPNMPRISIPITDLVPGWSADDEDGVWFIYRRTPAQAVSGASAVLGLCSSTWDNTNSSSIMQVATGTQRPRGNSINGGDSVSSQDHAVLALFYCYRMVVAFTAQTWDDAILTDPASYLTQQANPHVFDGGTISAPGAVTPSHVYVGAARTGGEWTEIGLSLSAVFRGATLS